MSNMKLDVHLSEDAKKFVIAVTDESGVEHAFTTESEKLMSLANHLLALTAEAARIRKKKPDLKVLDQETVPLIPTKGFSLTPSNDPLVMALTAYIGDQQLALAIPKNKLNEFSKSITDAKSAKWNLK